MATAALWLGILGDLGSGPVTCSLLSLAIAGAVWRQISPHLRMLGAELQLDRRNPRRNAATSPTTASRGQAHESAALPDRPRGDATTGRRSVDARRSATGGGEPRRPGDLTAWPTGGPEWARRQCSEVDPNVRRAVEKITGPGARPEVCLTSGTALPQVGVLRLEPLFEPPLPGYYVVFSGIYSSRGGRPAALQSAANSKEFRGGLRPADHAASRSQRRQPRIRTL